MDLRGIPHTYCPPSAVVSESDPGAIGAYRDWFNSLTGVLSKRNAADNGWDVVFDPGSVASDHGALTGLGDDDHTQYLKTDGTRALTGPQSAGGFKVTSLADGTAAGDAVNKGQLDAAVAGLAWKDAVRVATAAAGTLASDFENGDTVDGVVLATGDAILIKDQAAPAENGIYTVNASGAPTRRSDADSEGDLLGASVFVSEGTANGNTQWTMTTNAPITVGATSLTWAQLNTGGVTGSGTNGKLAKFTGGTSLGDSAVTEGASDLTSTKPLILPAGTTSIASLRSPHGSAPTSPVDGDIWTTSAGLFVRVNGVTIGPLSVGGGGDPWTEHVNESGASFANWAGVSGTWSSNGTEIIQTDTGATEHHAHLTAVQPTAMCLWEADATIVTGAGADSRVGLLTGYNASLSGVTVVVLRGDTVSGSVIEAIRQGTGVLGSESFASTYGTFYNLKLLIAGTRTSVFVNNTHYLSVHNTGDPANVRYIGLYSYQASVKFKNIKLYRPTLPGE